MTAASVSVAGTQLRMRNLAGRARVWTRLLAGFLFSTVAGQMLGMLAGLIYVRVLPVDQYAFYAICLATLSFVSLASDFGLTGSATYFWRKANLQKLSFSSYLAPIRRLRLWLIVIGGSIAGLAVPAIAARNGISPVCSVIAIVIVIATARVAADHALNQQLLRLSGRFANTYLADMSGQAVRLAMAAALLAGISASAIWALLGGLIGAIAAFSVSRSRVAPALEKAPAGKAPSRPARELVAYLMPVAPSVAVYALQDTVILWIAAASGGQNVVASVFALGRIGAIFAVIGNFVIGVIVPRLAVNNDDKRFGATTWGLRGLLFAGLMVAMGLSVLFPQAPLWLIGPNYGHLSAELPIVVAIAALNLMAFTSGVVNRARGWVRIEAPLAGIHGVVVATLVLNWNLASVDHVLMLMLAVAASHCLLHVGVSVAGTLWPHWVRL